MKKLALVASAATALICAASLVAAPADAKSKKHAKRPAAATSQVAAAPGYGGTGGPVHANGGPVRSGDMCWKDEGSRTQAQFGYWTACPKK